MTSSTPGTTNATDADQSRLGRALAKPLRLATLTRRRGDWLSAGTPSSRWGVRAAVEVHGRGSQVNTGVAPAMAHRC